MAILKAFKEWQHYYLGSKYKVKVHTNHRNIMYFTKTQKLSACQTRYFKTLLDFNYKLTYFPTGLDYLRNWHQEFRDLALGR
ncbi:hypothetical protein MKX08_000183 [Trichoderma sp. CBMAI-0020]|nr:hypothetical protein MKX08_000183 [Trichoderma sp. CBMAI-0020]